MTTRNPEKPDSENSADDAVAWLLTQRDLGNYVSPHDVIHRFPDHEAEISDFLANESRIVQIGEELATRKLPLTFGRYELIDFLGRGSFGEVRKAWDTQLMRAVALKTPRHLSQDDDSNRRFVREAQTTCQLDHPNIVRVYEVGESDSIPFIASEYIDGVALNHWKDRPVSIQSAVDIAVAIADGLEHAHNHGVVHRDLNPRNIMMDADDTPKLLDFGLAKFTADLGTVTIQGETLGTPAFVSPEQLRGDGHDVDGRADIYALGGILYELLTGRRPFSGDLKLLLHRVQYETPTAPHRINADVPRSLSRVCLKCLAKDPQQRYQSAADLAADLRNSLIGKATKARPLALRNFGYWIADRKWPAIAGWFAVGSQTLFTVWMMLSDLFKIRFNLLTSEQYLQMLPQLLLIAATTSLTTIVIGALCVRGVRWATWAGAGLAAFNLGPPLLALFYKPSFFSEVYESQPYFSFQVHLVISLIFLCQLTLYLSAIVAPYLKKF